MEKLKVKRINIYLTYQERKELNEIKYKYHLSYSTIIDIIANEVWNESQYYICNLLDHYIYEDEKSYKTCIKPKQTSYNEMVKQPTLYLTNVIKCFLKNSFVEKVGMKQDTWNKKKSRIYNNFQNTYDPNWDGNEWNKKFPKYIKQHKEYVKKVLEEC